MEMSLVFKNLINPEKIADLFIYSMENDPISAMYFLIFWCEHIIWFIKQVEFPMNGLFSVCLYV